MQNFLDVFIQFGEYPRIPANVSGAYTQQQHPLAEVSRKVELRAVGAKRGQPEKRAYVESLVRQLLARWIIYPISAERLLVTAARRQFITQKWAPPERIPAIELPGLKFQPPRQIFSGFPSGASVLQ